MIGPTQPLVGHGDAFADLVHLLRRASESRCGLVVVSGPAGVGKTALVEHLLTRHDGPTTRAVAASWERHRAHGVLTQLFPGLDVHADPVEIAERMTRQLTGTTVAVIDDAHWADFPSLQAIASAIRRHPDTRLLVVVTAVTDDPNAHAAALDLLPRVATAEIRLAPLTTAQVGELAASQGVTLPPSVADRLRRHTAGIGRHVVQLLAEVPASTWARFDPELPAPAAIAAQVRELLAACSPTGRSFAEAIAVLGDGTAVKDAARLAGVTDDLLPVLDEVSAAGLITFAPHGLTEVSPANPMVRAAVMATLGPARRAALHRQAAAVVDDPARALRLLGAASPMPDPVVADHLDTLATERAADGAWAAAASLLTDASRLTEDLSLRESRLTRAVDALIAAGDAFAATALMPEVDSLRETPARNAVLGYLAIVRGRATEAETRLGRAWDLVNAERDPYVGAMICQRHVLHALARCRPDDLVTWAERAISLAGADSPAAVETAAIRGLGLAGLGQTERARAEYAELATRVGHGAQAQRVTLARGWLNLMTDAVDDARADLESAVPTTFYGGSSRISLWARAWLARVQFLTGEWDEAERTVRDSWALVERSGIVLTGPLLGWTEVALHALRGDWAQAEQAEQAVLRCDAGSRDYEIMRIPVHLARAHIAEARADADGVLRALQPLTRTSAADDPGLWAWADMYAHALVMVGRHEEADSVLARHEQIAAARGHVSARARLSSARGRLLAAQGDLAAGCAAFEEALRLLDGLPLRYDQARVNFAYGQTLRRAGKRREADAVIAAARDLFAAMGGATYVARCDRELKAGGVHTGRPERVFNELTPQEQAVSQLVASGLSNRDVAAELFLSAKTVQYHLTRVYAKLGIRSRAELAARLNPR